MIHNWFTFVLLTLLPALFLMIGNAAILIAFYKWTQKSKKCSHSSAATQNRYKHQMKLTITILIVITLYLVGELPAHLTSRKSAVNLLYGGDVSRVDFKTMQRLEIICITLNSIQLSMNIIVYAVINPSFMPEFFSCLKGASDVCFRFMGITYITNCCGNCCKPKVTRNKQKTSECEQEGSSNRESEDNWNEAADVRTTTPKDNCNTKSGVEISVITTGYLKESFENPTFTKDTQ